MKRIAPYLIVLFFAACQNQPATETSESQEESTLFRPDTFRIPSSHHNLRFDDQNRLVAEFDGKVYTEREVPFYHRLSEFRGAFRGAENGLSFNFQSDFNGTLYFGFIPFDDYRYPQPVFFKYPAKISNGKGEIDLDQLRGKYDMVNWEETGHGVLGYRIAAEDGSLLYDGRIAFTGTGPFEVGTTITEGPFVNLVTPDGCTISFDLDRKTKPSVEVDGEVYPAEGRSLHNGTVWHYEAKIEGLDSDKEYEYSVVLEDYQQTHSFRTAPKPGARTAFTFAYCSDSRNGQGGGERNLFGANAYIMKKMMALASQEESRFLQFSGDLIDGYLQDSDEMDLQYTNWKHATEAFLHHMPVYVSYGNHESLNHELVAEDGSYLGIDRMPYATESGELRFREHFVNPVGLTGSEDGMSYDVDPENQDFPLYDETVFSYEYDNVAVVVLNSNYWYATNKKMVHATGGGQHGYVMDRQFEWFQEEIKALEANKNIDHVFVTIHTPFLPNGGHVKDDMWYYGNNEIRTWVGGKPLEKGIIERRDELLETMINQSTKVRAILTGDEHNYCRTEIGAQTNIYPEGWELNKITCNRRIWQINNGAAGAPYYAQEETPWSEFTQGFTTQNALVLLDVDGKSIKVRVINPDTLEEVDEFVLN